MSDEKSLKSRAMGWAVAAIGLTVMVNDEMRFWNEDPQLSGM